MLATIPLDALRSSKRLPDFKVYIPSSIFSWQITSLEIKDLKAPDQAFYPVYRDGFYLLPSYEAEFAYQVNCTFGCGWQRSSKTILVWGLDDCLYGYLPLWEEWPPSVRMEIPPGVSTIEITWEAKAVYGELMYSAEGKGLTLGPFLPLLEKISIRLARYGLVLAVLIVGLEAMFELFKSYMLRG